MTNSITQAAFRTISFAIACGTYALPSSAQTYPLRPIRMLIGFAPGGTVDIVARIVAPRLSERLHQQIVVDNRPGAGSSIASAIASKAEPDGYTLLMISSSHAINAALHPNLPYDAYKDFSCITQVATAPVVLIVTNSLSAHTVSELIALARAKPRTLNYGSSGIGGNSHLAVELLQSMAGIEMNHVPYKGSAPALLDVISGRLQLAMPTLPTALAQIKAGRVRALGVTSAKRSASLPDVPTIAEAGVPGYEASNWYALLGPAGMPRPIVDKLNALTIEVASEPAASGAIEHAGAEPQTGTPGECARLLRTEIDKWTQVIRKAGIQPN
jgi:tripartite-type tricarboxylate transporter receptor subunit TctC